MGATRGTRRAFLALGLAVWAAAVTAPAPAARAAGADDGAIRFQFDGIPYTEVVRRFAQQAGKPLVGDLNIAGTLTFFDSEPYSYGEALDTLNMILATRGYTLVETGRFLQLTPVKDIQKLPIEIYKGMEAIEDVRPGEVVTVILPLTYMDAETALTTLRPMVTQVGTLGALGKGKGLILTDVYRNVQRLRGLLGQIDTGALTERQIRTYRLEHAGAEEVAGILSKVLAAGGEGEAGFKMVYDPNRRRHVPVREGDGDATGLVVSADARTNTLILIGPPDKLALAEDLLAKLDVEGPTESGDLRIFVLKEADAENVAQIVREALPKTTTMQRDSRGRTVSRQVAKASVVADRATNRLIVAAPFDQMAKVEAILKELDQAGAAAEGLKVFQLKEADAQQLADVLQNSLSGVDPRTRKPKGDIRVTADPRTNCVVVAGAAADIAGAEALIAELDRRPDESARETHVVHLKAGDARQLAQSIARLYAQQQSSGRGRSGPSAASNVRVEADAGTNSLIISAAPGEWPSIQSILDQLKASAEPLSAPSTRMIPVQHAKAVEVAEALRPLFGASGGRGRRGRTSGGPTDVPVVISASAQTNALLVSAAADDMETIAGLVAALDVPSPEAVEPVRIIRLESAQAVELAETLRATLPEPPRGQPPTVLIQADAVSNSVLLRAPATERELLEDLIGRLDVATQEEARELRMIPLKATSAQAMAEMLSRVFAGRGTQPVASRSSRGRGWRPTPTPAAEGVVITPSPDDRMLVVEGPKKTVDEVAQLLESLDVGDTPEPVQFRTYDLAGSSAAELSKSLARLFAEETRGETSTQPAPRFEADTGANQLLVAAGESQFAVIDALLAKVQETTELASQTRTFTLQHADADRVASVLQAMLLASPPSPRGRRGRGVPTAADGEVRVAGVAETGLVVVQGPPERIALAEELIVSLDVPAGEAAQLVRMVRLDSADAAQLAEALRAMLPPAPKGQPQPIAIQAEPGSNSVLVRAPEAERERIETMLAELDQATQDEARELRIIRLKHVSASVVEGTLSRVASRGSGASRTVRRDRRGRPIPTPAAEGGVTVAAGPDDRSLVLEGPRKDVAQLAQLAETLDTADSPAVVQVRTYQLDASSAADLAKSLARLFAERQQGRDAGGDVYEPRFEADPATNQLLIAATTEQFKTIEGLVEEVKAATVLASQTRTFKLRFARPTELATLIEPMLGAARAPARSTARGRSPQPAPSDVKVAAMDATSTLVVQGPPETIALAEELVKTFDTEEAASESVLEIVRLEHADAAAIAPVVTASLVEAEAARGSSRGRGQPTVKAEGVTVTPEPHSGTLLVHGESAKVALALTVITSLDVPSPESVAPLVIVPVAAADAERVAETLQAMIPEPARGEAREVFIRGDAESGSVLLRAPEGQIEALKGMIASLDKAQQEEPRVTRVVELSHASAEALAETLGQLTSGGGGGGSRAVTFRRDSRGRRVPVRTPSAPEPDQVVIAASPDDRSLVLEGPKSKVDALEQLARTLDTGEAPSTLQVRTFQLAQAQASDLAQSLQRLFAEQRGKETEGPQPRFEADLTTNQLLIAATAEQFEVIEGLVAQVKAAPVLTSQTKTYRLKFAKASRVAEVLDALLSESPQAVSRGRGGRPPARPSTVRVAAMEATETVIVQGPPDAIARADELVKTLDAEDAAEGASVTQIVRLQNAQAVTLAEAVNRSLAEQGGAPAAGGRKRTATAAPAEGVDVTVTPEPNSNSVLVRGPAERVAEVVAMIRDLDSGGTSLAAQVYVIPLENGEAVTLADAVGELFRDMIKQQAAGRRDVTPPPFSISPDERTNSLIVSTTPAHYARVKKLLETLDQAPERALRDVHYMWLEYADASEVASKLNAMYSDRKGVDKPVIEADLYSNAVTIIAKAEDLGAIEPIIAKLDSAAQDTSFQVRVIPLTGLKASKMARIIQNVYQQMTESDVVVTEPEAGAGLGRGVLMVPPEEETAPALEGTPPGKAVDPGAVEDAQPVPGPAGGEGRIFQAPLREQVTIGVDPRANALIISGSRQELDHIETLISELMASAGSEEAEFRIFKIARADPLDVAQTLDQLFNPKQQKVVSKDPKAPQPPAPPPVITAVADQRTRNLIVRAKPLDFDLIEPLIRQLDQVPVSANEVRVFTLQNTDAKEVAANLKELLKLSVQQQAQAQRKDNKKPPANNKTATPQNRRAATVREAMELQAEDGVASVGSASMVTVTANTATNSVVVAAPPDVMELIARVITELDQSAALAAVPVVRLYPLAHAGVEPTVAALREVFVEGAKAGPKAPGGKASDQPIVITGDAAGRQVIVSAPAEKHDLVKAVLDEIDAAQAGEQVAVKVYRIRYAEAGPLATALSQTLAEAGGGKGPAATAGEIRINPDRGSNSVVVRASAADHERIASLIAEMDALPTEAYPVRLVPLKNADPETVAAMLGRIYGAGGSAAARGPGRGRPGRPTTAANASEVVIEADRAARTLVVRADEATFEDIRRLALEIDAGSVSGEVVQTLIALEHLQAPAAAAALTAAFAPARGRATAPEEQVTIVDEPFSNSLIVTANAENLEKVRSLLAKLDVEGVGGARTEFVILEHAKATALANVLGRVATAGSAAAGGRPGRTAAQGVVVSADAASNALVMTGPSADVDRLLQMARDLDQASERQAAGVYILPLANGEATTVAATIQDLYRQQQQAAQRDRRALDPLAVSADERANAVVLATTPAMYEQVSEWVGRVEQMTPSRGTLRIITLEHATPSEVEQAIQELFGEEGGSSAPVRRPGTLGRGGSSRGGSSRGGTSGAGGRVETTVLPQQRAVLVKASDADYEEIQKLVASLDAAAAETARDVQVFTLEKALNTQVAAALTQMYRQIARPERPEDEVSVTALANTNAVVVAAAKEKMAEVRHLIEQLDTQEVAPQVEFRLFKLENAQPEKILPALQQALAQVRQARPGEPINVQADERTRSIIVTARGPVFEQVETIIKALDVPAEHAAVEVQVVQLKRADATRLAAVLTDMLRPAEGNLVTPEARALQEQIRRLKIRRTDAEGHVELDLTKPIKIAADPVQKNDQGSNALILSSTPENLQALAAVVELMDRVPVTEGVRVRLLHLSSADAESVAAILQDIFTQGKALAGRTSTSVAGKAEPESITGKALVNVLNVSADPRTNTLVLSGLEETLALAELVVHDLDRASGKIVTEVRLFKLQHATVERLVPVLQSVFAEGSPDPGTEGLRTHVSRLRTVLDGADEGHGTEIARSRAALVIQGDPTTSVLIVAARSDVMPLIADVVEKMDVPGAGSMNAVRIFPLMQADATRLKTVMDGLYTGPNASLIRDEDKPTVVVDTRTNSLVVSASDKTFALLGTLISKLDAKEAVGLHEVRIVPLKNAEADAMADTLQQMMDARVQRQEALGQADAEALRVLVLPDLRTNSLLVGGSIESYKLVRSLAEELDGASAALSGQVQLFPLAHANAGTMSQTLGDLFERRYQAARTEGVKRQQPVILPDLRTNSLMVAANADDSKVLVSLLAKLDVELKDPAVRLEVLPLDHNDAGVVGPMLKRLFDARLASMTPPGATPAPQDKVDLEADALANALVVSASKENLGLIRDLLAKVDVEPPTETGLVRMYALRHADAARVAAMLEGLLSRGLYKPGLAAAAGNDLLQAREKVALAVDTRTNVLIVSASRENAAVIDEIVARVDAEEDFGLLGDVRVYRLAHADAALLAPTLQEFFDAKRSAEEEAGGASRSLAVTILPDERTNALLVTGGREVFPQVERLLGDLDAARSVASEFRVFRLEQATATALQPTLERLFAERVLRGQEKDPVTVIADARSNALIVGAAPEDMALAASLIERLDTSIAEGLMHLFPLAKADATRVAETLRSLFESEGAAEGIGISVDERTNSLIVSAGAADIKRIAELLKRLDTDAVTRVTEVRIFSLKNADAEALAEILTTALTEKPPVMTGESPNRQTVLQFVARTQDGRDLIASALQEGVLITPDRRTNSLIVSAPLENMPFLDSLIGALDSVSPRLAEIRVLTLQNADAGQMAEVLTELFRLEEGGAGDDARSVSYTLVKGDEAAGPSATLGTAEQYALTVTVDARTNSLLVGGTEHYVTLVEQIVRELDASPAQERMTEVYRLRNAQAPDIETALRSFLDQERDRLVAALGDEGLGAAQRLLEREVAIVAEEQTNTLLLSASPRYFRTVADMIRELDQPPPQVLIQVLLAEVRLDDTLDLGMDWNVSGIFDRDKNYDVGTTFGAEANFGATGFGIAITGGSFQYWLRALEDQGRLEVLSRPQILATDNQQARINVGQRVPFITDSRITDQGTTFNTVDYRDVGIILDVLPRISADGFVRMEVKPEISSIEEDRIQISENVNAIIVNTRTAETTVTVQDGHTIIIGGLIQSTDQVRENKVPLLGDIPGLGALFRSTHDVKDRRELLIILTPVILRNSEDADLTTAGEIERLNRLRQAVREEAEAEAQANPWEVLVPENGKEVAGEVEPITGADLPKDALVPKPKPGGVRKGREIAE